MVMNANFVITWKPILACWACSHRGKNGLTNQKIEIFKVHDIDTIIQPGKKTHQTHVSSALKTFYDDMRRLWDRGKIFQNFTSHSRDWIMVSISWTLKISIFWLINPSLPLWEQAQQTKMGFHVITKLASMTIKFQKWPKHENFSIFWNIYF